MEHHGNVARGLVMMLGVLLSGSFAQAQGAVAIGSEVTYPKVDPSLSAGLGQALPVICVCAGRSRLFVRSDSPLTDDWKVELPALVNATGGEACNHACSVANSRCASGVAEVTDYRPSKNVNIRPDLYGIGDFVMIDASISRVEAKGCD